GERAESAESDMMMGVERDDVGEWCTPERKGDRGRRRRKSKALFYHRCPLQNRTVAGRGMPRFSGCARYNRLPIFEANASMKLIGSLGSPYVRKVRIVMLEKRIEYD